MKGKNAQYNGKIKREDQADGLKAEKIYVFQWTANLL